MSLTAARYGVGCTALAQLRTCVGAAIGSSVVSGPALRNTKVTGSSWPGHSVDFSPCNTTVARLVAAPPAAGLGVGLGEELPADDSASSTGPTARLLRAKIVCCPATVALAAPVDVTETSWSGAAPALAM